LAVHREGREVVQCSTLANAGSTVYECGNASRFADGTSLRWSPMGRLIEERSHRRGWIKPTL